MRANGFMGLGLGFRTYAKNWSFVVSILRSKEGNFFRGFEY
jgi:hypothetical protein